MLANLLLVSLILTLLELTVNAQPLQCAMTTMYLEPSNSSLCEQHLLHAADCSKDGTEPLLISPEASVGLFVTSGAVDYPAWESFIHGYPTLSSDDVSPSLYRLTAICQSLAFHCKPSFAPLPSLLPPSHSPTPYPITQPTVPPPPCPSSLCTETAPVVTNGPSCKAWCMLQKPSGVLDNDVISTITLAPPPTSSLLSCTGLFDDIYHVEFQYIKCTKPPPLTAGPTPAPLTAGPTLGAGAPTSLPTSSPSTPPTVAPTTPTLDCAGLPPLVTSDASCGSWCKVAYGSELSDFNRVSGQSVCACYGDFGLAGQCFWDGTTPAPSPDPTPPPPLPPTSPPSFDCATLAPPVASDASCDQWCVSEFGAENSLFNEAFGSSFCACSTVLGMVGQCTSASSTVEPVSETACPYEIYGDDAAYTTRWSDKSCADYAGEDCLGLVALELQYSGGESTYYADEWTIVNDKWNELAHACPAACSMCPPADCATDNPVFTDGVYEADYCEDYVADGGYQVSATRERTRAGEQTRK